MLGRGGHIRTNIGTYRGSLRVVEVPYMPLDSFPDGFLHCEREHICWVGLPSEASLSDFFSKLEKKEKKPSNFKRVNYSMSAKFSCTFLGISNLAFTHSGRETQTKLWVNIEEGYSPKECRIIADKCGVGTARCSRCFSLGCDL